MYGKLLLNWERFAQQVFIPLSVKICYTLIIGYLSIVFLGIPLDLTGKAERGFWTLGSQESLQESRQYFCFTETV